MAHSDRQPDRLCEFTEAWMKAVPVVSAFISSSIHNVHDAEDTLQIVAMDAARDFGKYDKSKPFVNWVMGIARIRVLRYFSQRSKAQWIFDDQTLCEIAVAHEDIEPEIQDRKEALRHCMKQMGGRGRRILELRYVESAMPIQIAKRVGMSSNAVSVLLFRLRQALRKCIEQRLASIGGNR